MQIIGHESFISCQENFSTKHHSPASVAFLSSLHWDHRSNADERQVSSVWPMTILIRFPSIFNKSRTRECQESNCKQGTLAWTTFDSTYLGILDDSLKQEKRLFQQENRNTMYIFHMYIYIYTIYYIHYVTIIVYYIYTYRFISDPRISHALCSTWRPISVDPGTLDSMLVCFPTIVWPRYRSKCSWQVMATDILQSKWLQSLVCCDHNVTSKSQIDRKKPHRTAFHAQVVWV